MLIQRCVHIRRLGFGCLAVLASIVVLSACGSWPPQTLRTSNVGPQSTSPPAFPAVPTGDLRVNYGEASIVVPADWQTLQPGVTNCDPDIANDVVLLGDAAIGGPSCGTGQSPPSPTSFARLQPLPARAWYGATRTINGHTAILTPTFDTDGGTAYAFPDLGIDLAVTGPQTDSIVATIGWSSQHLALYPPYPASVPASWGTTTYDGVTVRLPRTWPLTKVGGTLGSPGCGADFNTPQLLEGPPITVLGCPLIGGPPPAVDGVWLQGPAGLTGNQINRLYYTTLRSAPTKVVLQNSDPANSDPLVHLLVVGRHGTIDGVDVGIGPDPRIAAAIVASIAVATESNNATTNPTAAPAPHTASTSTALPGPIETTTPSPQTTIPSGFTVTTTNLAPTTPPNPPTTCAMVSTTYQPDDTDTFPTICYPAPSSTT